MRIRPSLDHFNGRKVVGVFLREESTPWSWVIQLEGEAFVSNEDKRRTEVPEEIRGLIQMMVIQSEAYTRVVYGKPEGPHIASQFQIELTPTLYTLDAPEYEQRNVHPQWPEELEETLPPAQADEFEVAGPMPFEETGGQSLPTVVKRPVSPPKGTEPTGSS